ncbi:MAG: S41 family peptidase [Ferruginibacter sp.]
MLKKLSPLIIVMAFAFASCKKATPDVAASPLVTTTTQPPVAVSDDIIKDSVLFYSKDIYLWNTQVPSTFNPRTYADPNKVMEAMRQYSSEPGFTQPVDHYSFAVKKIEWDNASMGMSSVQTAMEANGDFGLTVFFRAAGDLRVRLVEPNSPAGLAGIHRGWRITKINSSTDITTGNSEFIVDNIYNAATANVTFQKPDGSSVAIDLIQAHYALKPVYLDTVYTVNNKKVGYLVFNSFLGDVDKLYIDFQRVFNHFTSSGIQDIVVDLRYNGGGYVSVQQQLADYLVNSSANGGVMMKEVYNTANTSSNETTLFHKTGALNLNRIYFIVGKATASASELLINNLKPYMDVKLIGGTTYGKPVGFFPIPVGDWYIFPVSFRSFNKNGDGNYFNGITVNSAVADGLDKDWGDLTETCLASAVKNISTGAFRPDVATEQYVLPADVVAGNEVLDRQFLKTTIGSRPNH